MQNWKKLFSVENRNIKRIHDYNGKLKGLVIDNKVSLITDGLLELCDDVTHFKS